jgi:hypothetical protein
VAVPMLRHRMRNWLEARPAQLKASHRLKVRSLSGRVTPDAHLWQHK